MFAYVRRAFLRGVGVDGRCERGGSFFLFSAVRVAESERKKQHRKVCLISLIVMG